MVLAASSARAERRRKIMARLSVVATLTSAVASANSNDGAASPPPAGVSRSDLADAFANSKMASEQQEQAEQTKRHVDIPRVQKNWHMYCKKMHILVYVKSTPVVYSEWKDRTETLISFMRLLRDMPVLKLINAVLRFRRRRRALCFGLGRYIHRRRVELIDAEAHWDKADTMLRGTANNLHDFMAMWVRLGQRRDVLVHARALHCKRVMRMLMNRSTIEFQTRRSLLDALEARRASALPELGFFFVDCLTNLLMYVRRPHKPFHDEMFIGDALKIAMQLHHKSLPPNARLSMTPMDAFRKRYSRDCPYENEENLFNTCTRYTARCLNPAAGGTQKEYFPGEIFTVESCIKRNKSMFVRSGRPVGVQKVSLLPPGGLLSQREMSSSQISRSSVSSDASSSQLSTMSRRISTKKVSIFGSVGSLKHKRSLATSAGSLRGVDGDGISTRCTSSVVMETSMHIPPHSFDDDGDDGFEREENSNDLPDHQHVLPASPISVNIPTSIMKKRRHMNRQVTPEPPVSPRELERREEAKRNLIRSGAFGPKGVAATKPIDDDRHHYHHPTNGDDDDTVQYYRNQFNMLKRMEDVHVAAHERHRLAYDGAVDFEDGFRVEPCELQGRRRADSVLRRAMVVDPKSRKKQQQQEKSAKPAVDLVDDTSWNPSSPGSLRVDREAKLQPRVPWPPKTASSPHAPRRPLTCGSQRIRRVVTAVSRRGIQTSGDYDEPYRRELKGGVGCVNVIL
eukprot:PhM_4_TR4945/c0_g1_i1/m.35585